MAKTSKAQLKASERYHAKQRQIAIRIDRTTEEGLLRWLEAQESMQGYIKDLITMDMNSAEVFDVEDEAGNKIEQGLAYDEAYESVESYERDDVRDGTYVSGSYYIRNTETGYCERIYT